MGDLEKEATLEQEKNDFEIKIKDSREIKNPDFPSDLSERIMTDHVHEALIEAYRFFGKYAAEKPQDLTIILVDGVFGEGTIKGTSIELQIPPIEELLSNTRTSLEPMLKGTSEEEKEDLTKQLILAVAASTTLHEGTHSLLNSKPGSKLATEIEELSGIENIEGKISTLLDEGITYAIQEIYAPKIKPIGSIAPRINENDREAVKIRKELGHRLRPIVENYLNFGKSMDRDFIATASQELKEVLINSQI